MKAVVMAGGEGTRLRPLTSNQPKPMVPIVGKPCMEHILELLKSHGFEDVIVTVAFLPAGDPLVLRQRRDAGDGGRLLGRGVAARHRRLREARRGQARRHVPRHLRRRVVRRRPDTPRRVPSREGGVGHDRPEVRREPARVRDRRDGRGRPRRALPREAVVGPGLLRHDQHRHLRRRRRGHEARADRPTVRLLEGALSAAARDGTPDLRLRARRLLAGHRQPRAIPPGELRRARREGAARHSRHPHSRQHLGGGGRRPARPRCDRGTGLHRQLLPDRSRRLGRPVLRALDERDTARARACIAVGDRLIDVRRPQRGRRGRDHRPRLRPARAHARARGRRDRRRGEDRCRERDHAGRTDLPVQGGRDRLARLREPHLGVARHDARLRQGRRPGPRQRRPHARHRSATRRRVRDRAEARRPRRRRRARACRRAG